MKYNIKGVSFDLYEIYLDKIQRIDLVFSKTFPLWKSLRVIEISTIVIIRKCELS